MGHALGTDHFRLLGATPGVHHFGAASSSSRPRPVPEMTTVRARFRRRESKATESDERQPDIILVGTGVGDGLQLTVEAQRVLDTVGKAYALHLPAAVRRHLRSLRIKTVDLSERFAEPRPLGEAYVEVADYLMERAAAERPIVVLTPG